MTAEISSLSCAETVRRVHRGEISSRECVQAALESIERTDSAIGAFLDVLDDAALARADTVDARSEAERRKLPLAGVPVAIKDTICVQDAVVTAGSRMLTGYVSPYSATVVEKLERAGAICVGKTNCDEFAMGSSTENSALGRTVNPRDPTRVPGGSSGGSAASVAAGQVPVALGSDTGGSIRQPSALCGVVGLKPTYGRVSRYGLVAFASSLDQIGPIARTVEDTAMILDVISGADPHDSTSVDMPGSLTSALVDVDPARLTVGVPRSWSVEGLCPEVRNAVETTIAQIEASGARIHPVDLPHQDLAVATYHVIATAEASANLARYDGVRFGRRAEGSATLEEMMSRSRSEGFGPEVKRRILLGTYVLSAGYYEAYYQRAQKVRTLIRRDFEAAFTDVDVLVGPTTPTTAFRTGEKAADPLAMYLSDVFTVPASLAGLPSISVPCGSDSEGLPVGLQIVGAAAAEATVLRVAALVEQLRGRIPIAAI